MAKYQITHACGHQQTHSLHGPSRDRASRERWLEGTLCSECYAADLAAKRSAEAEQAKAAAEENGLPPLVGTPKQVEWAERIRQQVVQTLTADFQAGIFDPILLAPIREDLQERYGEQLRELSRRVEDAELLPALAEACRPLLWEALASADNASWWIEQRYALDRSRTAAPLLVSPEVARRAWGLLLELLEGRSPEEAVRSDLERQAQAEAERREQDRLRLLAEAEAVIVPEQVRGPLVAAIEVGEKRVTVSYPQRDDALLKIVHRFDSDWDGEQHVLASGEPVELAVELAHRFLREGFRVRLWDPELRRRAVAGDYTPYTGRKVLFIQATGQFYVAWDRRREDWHAQVRQLPGARRAKGAEGFSVPAAAWQEVEDFAGRHGFALSDRARERLEMQRELAAKLLPEPVAPTPAVVSAQARPELDATEPEIPAHLRDEDAP